MKTLVWDIKQQIVGDTYQVVKQAKTLQGPLQKRFPDIRKGTLKLLLVLLLRSQQCYRHSIAQPGSSPESVLVYPQRIREHLQPG